MRLPVVVSLLTFGAAVSFAQEPVTGTDRATIAACLKDALDQPRACIGAVAVLCLAEGGPPDVATTASEAACALRETLVWRERMDLAARALDARIDPALRPRAAAVAEAWRRFAGERCAFMAELATADRVGPTEAGCILRATALRAIELERLQRRRAAGEDGALDPEP